MVLQINWCNKALLCGFIDHLHLTANGAGFDSNFLTTKPTSYDQRINYKQQCIGHSFRKKK